MAEYIDKAQVQTELMMNAERYTVAHESNGFGIVEWSDNLIPVSKAMEIIRNIPSIEAIPIEWLTAQADNPSNSDKLRNAIDYIVYTLWAERKEHETD